MSRWQALLAAAMLFSGAVARADDRARAMEQISKAPLEAAGFAALAAALFREGDVERAAAAAEEAARLEPQTAVHHRLVGYLHAAAGAARQAEAAFRRASEIDRSESTSLADFHLARAWAEYQEELRRHPPNPEVEERVRLLAAIAEISPELKALLRPGRPRAGRRETAAAVPPVWLAAEGAHAVVVEKRTQTVRLYTRRGEEIELMETFPCTTGQALGNKERRGDNRTPDGVYLVSDLLRGEALPESYGALALPLSYPNAWDRRLGRGGYGIWLHGSDRLSSPFTPRDTQGCVVMRNDDLLELARTIAPGETPVLIEENVAYRPEGEWAAAVAEVRRDHAAGEVMAMAAVSDYAVVLRREGGDVVRDFLRKADRWTAVASERSPAVPAEQWAQKVAGTMPPAAGALIAVTVLDAEEAPRIVVDTTAPARARGFRPELGDRLYVDLAGVRPAPLPAVVPGSGPWVKQIRVAAATLDPPVTRLAIYLLQPADYRVAAEGNRVTVWLNGAGVAGAPRAAPAGAEGGG